MKDEFLTRLIYASTVTEAYSRMELVSILEACKRNNPKLGVTGLLFIDERYFFQCLEGTREGVNLIYQKLLCDDRHQRVEILELKEVGQRYFDGWNMKYVPSGKVANRILRQTGMKKFDPYAMDTWTANQMLEGFRAYQDLDDSTAPPTATQTTEAKRNKNLGLGGLFKRPKQLAY